MKAILGRKLGMSQVFSPTGEAIGVTLILALPNVITLRRSRDKDGYVAVQLALPKQAPGPQAKEPSGQKQNPRRLSETYAARREFPVAVSDTATTVTVEQFAPGDVVEVFGVSKGKGFAGVVKRHHFKGGPASHGHRHVLRRPGSIGSRFPQHTRKGMRMAGRMGGDRVTVKNLQVVVVDASKNLLAVKGAVPGTRGSIVAIVSRGALTAEK